VRELVEEGTCQGIVFFLACSFAPVLQQTKKNWASALTWLYQSRLPRNHPDVLANMDDLAKCIRIMPTSGQLFTAQAPLLPVFFLGLLATNPAHKEVSRAWFQQVTNTPVRSVSENNQDKRKKRHPPFS
jgi:hypothetical protein